MQIVRCVLRTIVFLLTISLFFVDFFINYSIVYQTLMGFVVFMFLAEYEKDRNTIQLWGAGAFLLLFMLSLFS